MKSIWRICKNTFRYLCLKAAGEASLLHRVEVLEATVDYLSRLHGINIAVSETDLIYTKKNDLIHNKKTNTHKLRVFFVMSNKYLYNTFLESFYHIYLDETRQYLERFNEAHKKSKTNKVLRMSNYRKGKLS